MPSIIVTGAAGGLGEAIARMAGARGYRVGVLDLDQAKAEKVAGDIENAVGLAVNVADEASVEAAVEAFGETPDALVNNAGTLRTGPLIDHPAEDFRLVMDVNLTGQFLMARAVARGMIERGKGAIVNIASTNGITPAVNCGAYAAAKAGLIVLSRHMTMEWGPQGVRVNSVSPGFIDAGMSAPFFKDQKVREKRGGGVPLRRLGLADDVAETVMFLASDASAYVSGQDIAVDGGVIHAAVANLPRE
ncbi:MAG: SDR family NAD(P)-dependent oxidoreductase [Pseudomonadota bacterium]